MFRVSTQFVAIAALSSCAMAQKDTIVQMFGWNWASVAQECTQYLGPAGFAYVQVSPPQETVTGDSWWTDYQPVSYTIDGKRGDRAGFAAMVDACHKVGVKVIADSVINHMAGSDAGSGTAGSSYTHYDYPGLYTTDSFHHCGLTPNDDIEDYDDRAQVQTCELVNLADLNTGDTNVQTTIAAYLSDLLSLGVDGLRLDASKHMATDDIGGILSKLTKSPEYITQEVIWGSGEPIQPSEYIQNGNVQEFRYTEALQTAFLSSGIASLPASIPGDGWLSSDDANVFVANHDTERNAGSLNYASPSNTYTLAHVFMLAYPYGTPTVLSSFTFTDYDDGAPNGAMGSCFGDGGVNGWLCQHRFPPIEGLSAFRAAVVGTEVTNAQRGTEQQLAFARGTSGFVAINNEDVAWSGTFPTGLAPGNYCDVYFGPRNVTGSCGGAVISVGDDGSVSLNIAPRTASAIFVGAEAPLGAESSVPPPSSTTVPPAVPTSTRVTFRVQRNTTYGDNVFVVGSIPELGSWDVSKAIGLSPASYPIWSADVTLPSQTSFEYKYIVKTGAGVVQWEADPNRNGLPNAVANWQVQVATMR